MLKPLAVILIGVSSAWAQQVISAHSGVIHFVEGQVTLDGEQIQPKFAEFPDVKNGQTLAAEDGRAEVLLTPGVILRVGENSSFKMISNSRSDTRLQMTSGSAVVEVGELLPSNAITLMVGSAHIELVKRGLYRVDVNADPGKLRVYEGEARITEADQSLVVRKGRQVLMGAVLDMGAFDLKETDSLMRWASRRSEYLAQANISSARAASDLGYVGSNSYASTGGMGTGLGSGMGTWAYNPWYGMFTYLPYGNNMYYSPFGYPYYSVGTIGYYIPPTYSGISGFPVSSSSVVSSHYNATGSGLSMTPRTNLGSTASAAAAQGVRTSSVSSGSGASSSGGSFGGASSGGSAGGMGGRSSGGARGK